MADEENCIPILQCQCCKCQGKMCLMWHPGHSHNNTLYDPRDLLKERIEVLKESVLDTDFGGK